MGNVPAAKVSPRVANGMLCWYAGDVFRLQLELTMRDQDGEEVILPEGDIRVVFYDERREVAHAFEETLHDNRVTLEFTEEITQKFPAGKYTYDVKYADGTLASGNVCRVEG